MSDFMIWLYANYIKPQISIPAEEAGYTFHMDIVRNNLCMSDRKNLEKVLKFTAIQAFLLGMRTGEGLAASRR